MFCYDLSIIIVPFVASSPTSAATPNVILQEYPLYLEFCRPQAGKRLIMGGFRNIQQNPMSGKARNNTRELH
jgi:hypothetical protein